MILSGNGATSNDGFVVVDPPYEQQEETPQVNEHLSNQSPSTSTSPTTDRRPQATGGHSPSSSSSTSLDDFCQSFEHAMTIAQHAERAKAEARTAIDRAETARNLAEQAWGQAMSAAEAAQSIARSGLAVAKLSLDACNLRSRPNHPTASLKNAFDLFASQREPIMDFERFQQALSYDDGTAFVTGGEFEAEEAAEREYPCDMYNCTTCRNRQRAQSWRFFKVSPEFGPTPKGTPRNLLSESCQPLPPKLNAGPGPPKRRDDNARKPTGVPKCFEKYSSPLALFSATSPRMPKTTHRTGNITEQGKVCGVSIPAPNQIGEKFLQLNPGPMPARPSTSDELEYLTFWSPSDSPKLDDPFQSDDGASSDDSSHSAPVFLGVRTRRAESCEEGLLSSPLKPRQLQRLSDMEPGRDTEEIARARFHLATAARSQSCSSEPGADQTKRPCSPLVLPDVDSGTNVQILPNNVQAFQPPPLKSTTPPTSRHGHVTSSTNSYLSD
ncbi:uncharacterized protein LOC105438528 [Strongylocentrotus purpuratus]|uniref:Uncharacterized protein n=1 Tax=Strongylocentrotus purpuratus TaxID=7668 RepID=A0A7M7P6M2_STRPU|nr:uncharacterized protein LOC105438528 [Strongylocentrotus purpuratus]